MKKRYLFGVAAVVASVVFVGLGSYSGTSPFHAKCDTLAMASNVQESFHFKVPRGQLKKFNDVVVSYLRGAGFTYETSRSDDYLSPPNAAGEQSRFLNVKTIGCTYRTIVWSENVVSESDVSVTVHRTWLGNKASAARVASDLRGQLGAWLMPDGRRRAEN